MKNKASIYIDCYQLRKLLHQAQFYMTKADRIVYGTPALERCGKVLSHFVMAYDFADERDRYIREFVADFEVLKIDLRIMTEINAIKEPRVDGLNAKGKALSLEMLEIIGRIDEGMRKWRNSLKGKTSGV